jgi:antitoxin (DNA-binding transcriptional repressor) of toxin-antitoxin stability system
MILTGIRDLKNNVTHYLRQIAAGKRVAVAARGRVIAELLPPATRRHVRRSREAELIAAGIIEPAAEPDGLPESGRTSACPLARLPS